MATQPIESQPTQYLPRLSENWWAFLLGGLALSALHTKAWLAPTILVSGSLFLLNRINHQNATTKRQ